MLWFVDWHDLTSINRRDWRDIVAAIMVCVAVIVCWPALALLFVWSCLFGSSNASETEETEFAVTHTDLLEIMNIQDIEKREMVDDPLGAVPDLPFGHLHTAWEKFLECVEPEDSIWTFSANRNEWGRDIKRLGYAVVRRDKIVSHFLTMEKNLKEHSK
jgi:hypothetical protein